MTRASVRAVALPFTASLAVLAGCSDTSHSPFRAAQAFEHTRQIVGMSPRQPGSPGIRNVANYIEQQLVAIDPKLRLERQTFKRPDIAGETEFQNLWVELPGGEPNGPVIAFMAHYDSKITHPGEQDFQFVGALDAAASCGILLELAYQLYAKPAAKANIWLIWVDGEESLEWEWNDAKALIGSTHFAATMAEDKTRFPDGLAKRMRALVLLDLLGDANLKIDRDTESNPRLLDIFGDAAKKIGFGDAMYRYQSPMKDDHIPFKLRGVRVIDLIDFRYRPPQEHGPNTPPDAAAYSAWWHTAEDTLDKVSEASLQKVGDLVMTALPMLEAEVCK